MLKDRIKEFPDSMPQMEELVSGKSKAGKASTAAKTQGGATTKIKSKSSLKSQGKAGDKVGYKGTTRPPVKSKITKPQPFNRNNRAASPSFRPSVGVKVLQAMEKQLEVLREILTKTKKVCMFKEAPRIDITSSLKESPAALIV
nr:uncharacterized protein CTRU02_13676 [Colletotrichum truncatum]KAF6783024.1 hypothetical protein CTRU02_13676 [Colletotrichum truncatum]